MNKFLEAVHDMIEIITGERPESPTDKDWETVRSGEDRRSGDRRAKGYTEEHTKEWLDWAEKPKRARTKGRYKADDKSTKEFNEAWVGGKAPRKRKKKRKK